MRRKIILITISVLILILSVLGITYAFMRPQVEKKEEKSNITINACAKIQLKDSGNSIDLGNTYPMDDEMGLETKPYEFTITSTCEDYVGFNLYLTSLTDNEIEDNNIHFAITSKENTVLVSDILSKADSGLNDFNTDELKELDIGIKGTHKNIYKVYSNNISLKGESNYKLYLWLDKDASNETMGKSFKVGLSVKSYSREKTIADVCLGKTAECFTQNANLDSTLYYHDGNADYDGMPNYEKEAGDLNYRYSGADEDVKNYVCLDSKTTGKCESDDDLYRIIGFFKNVQGNYEIKLIKAQGATTTELGDSETVVGGAYGGLYNINYSDQQSFYKGTNWETLAGYYWNRNSSVTNMWQYSKLNKVNLNSYFYNYITNRASYLQNHITRHTWTTGGYSEKSNNGNAKSIYDAELGDGKVKEGESVCYTQGDTSTARPCTKEDLEYKAYIGLFYVSDYMYGARPASWTTLAGSYNRVTSYNWLYSGIYEWFISRTLSDGLSTRFVYSTGYASYYDHAHYYRFGVRPSFYLMTEAKIKEGEGSKMKPYRITFE